jgi:hypothetical protein
MRDLMAYLVDESSNRIVTPEDAIAHLGLRGRIIDVNAAHLDPARFSDDDKSQIFITKALTSAITCNVCGGKLDPNKSVFLRPCYKG